MSYLNKSMLFLGVLSASVHAYEGIWQKADRIEQSSPLPIISDEALITAPGYYALGADVMGPIDISASGVTLDLNGYTIESSLTNGIQALGGVDDLVIRNGTITNALNNGIEVDNATNVLIDDMSIHDCGQSGISLVSCIDCHVARCNANNNVLSGILLQSCQNSGVAACSLNVNQTGALLLTCTNCEVSGCTASACYGQGFMTINGAATSFDHCNALSIQSDVASVSGFTASFGKGTVFTDCMSNSIETIATDTNAQAVGFSLFAETDGVIQDCFVDGSYAVSSQAYGIDLGMLESELTQSITLTAAATAQIVDVSWDPAGAYLAATVALDATDAIYIFSFTGTLLESHSMLVTTTSYGHVRWSPDGNAVAVCGSQGGNGVLSVYPVSGGILGVPVSITTGDIVYDVDWSSDGSYLAITGKTGTNGFMRTYNFSGGVLTLDVSSALAYIGYSISISYEDQFIAVSGQDTLAGVGKFSSFAWQPGFVAPLQALSMGTNVLTVAWSPVEDVLALMSSDSLQQVSDLHIYQMSQNFLSEQSDTQVGNVDFEVAERVIDWSPDGAYVACAHLFPGLGLGSVSFNCYLTIFSSAGELLMTESIYNQVLSQRTLGWAPQGTYVATGGVGPVLTDANISLFSFFKGSLSNGAMVLHNKVCHVHGDVSGIGISGVATDNRFIGNIAYNNDTNYSLGIDNVSVGYGSTPGLLANISL